MALTARAAQESFAQPNSVQYGALGMSLEEATAAFETPRDDRPGEQ